MQQDSVPVVLFVFNRTDQLRRTLEGLKRNRIPQLYIFADGPRHAEDEPKVAEVRRLIDAITWTEVIKCYSPTNKGLSESIQTGLSEIFISHDKAIVLEDDVYVAPQFYAFMKSCLDTYAQDEHIAGVTGLRYPFTSRSLDSDAADVFMTPRFSSWGWGTWKRQWDSLSFDSAALMACVNNTHRLDAGGADLPSAIEAMASGQLTGCWDVYFYLNMVLQDRYFVWPKWNMVENLGLTEGSHAGGELPPWDLVWEKPRRSPYNLPIDTAISDKILTDFLAFFLPENLNRKRTTPPKHHNERTVMEPIKHGINAILHKAGFHLSKHQPPASPITETSEAPVAAPAPEQEAAPKPNPNDYSTTDDPQEVPCQKETYYYALNNLVPAGGKVLDVGIGLGYGMGILSILAGEVHGVDVDKKAVDYATKELLGKNPKIKSIQTYDGYQLPFDDNEFDTVTCVDVLEHVEDYDRFIKELLRVSKSTVIFGTPNRRPEFTNTDGTPKNVWHLREWSRDELDAIVSKHADISWNVIDGPWDGPFTISNKPGPGTMVLMPVMKKRG